jgi:hypothetical protein
VRPPVTPTAAPVARAIRIATLLLLPLALAACQPPGADEWTKPGATGADLRSDLTDCLREGTGPPPFSFWALNESYDSARARITRLKDACMIARGWQPVAQAPPPPPR